MTTCRRLLAQSFVVAAAGALCVAAVAPERPPEELRLVDDRGFVIEDPVELCWLRDLSRECTLYQPGSPVLAPGSFDRFTVAGPHHGPATYRRGELPRGDDGKLTAAVPRKALLRVEKLPEEPLAFSLYQKTDPTFRRPFFRSTRVPEHGIEVPAGDFVASLSLRGRAPDLRLLTLEPGNRQTIEFRERSGWSVVLRVLDGASGEPIADALVEVSPSAGYGVSDPGLAAASRAPREKTDPAGLAVFSGITLPLAAASASKPSYLMESLPGLASGPGTFAFQELTLRPGGSARVRVTLEGEPASGALCRVLKYSRSEPGSKAAPGVLFEAKSDSEGLCITDNLREGRYTLRLAPREARISSSPSFVDRPLTILDGEEVPVEVDLLPISLRGTVYRGTRSAPGLEVIIYSFEDPKPNATKADAIATAETDEEGEYEILLWSPGRYSVLVEKPDGTPAMRRTLLLGEGGERTLDFHLGAFELQGRAIDEHDQPVVGAAIVLIWETTYYRLALTDEDGGFAFPLEDQAGSARLEARKRGYREPVPLDLALDTESAPPPVVLRFTRAPAVHGELFSSSGAALAGGWVWSYRVEGVEQPMLLGTAITDLQGSFEVAAAEAGGSRLFFGGPTCPLGVSEVANPDPEATLRFHCSALPASVTVQFREPDGDPVEGARVLLRRGDAVIPPEVLVHHLTWLGLPAVSDGRGQVSLVALAPGAYELYLGGAANAASIQAGLPNGRLGQFSLAPLAMETLQVTLAEP